MKNEVAAISIAVALVIGGLVGYYGGGGAALGTTTTTTTQTTTITTTPVVATTTHGTDLDSISLYSGVSLCSSNCNYPSPYLSGTVLVNASVSLLGSLRLVVNGTDEGVVANFTSNPGSTFAYELKSNPHNPAMPIQSGKTYSILLIATFQNGDTSTASTSTVASGS